MQIHERFHFKSLSVLWKAVFAACKEFDVQLVATTHSYECVQAFAEAENHEGDIALIGLTGAMESTPRIVPPRRC